MSKTFPTFEKYVTEIKRRAIETDDVFRFVFYDGIYFGVDLSTVFFKGNKYRAFLKFDEYLNKNITYGHCCKKSHIGYLKSQYEIAYDCRYEIEEDEFEGTILEKVMKFTVESITSNDTLWMERTTIPKAI